MSAEGFEITPRAEMAALAMRDSLPGMTVPEIAAAALPYDGYFARTERPDPRVHPGMYVYERYLGTLPRRTVRFAAEDGVMLAGYFYEVEASPATVVFSHGFHAAADEYLPLIEAIVRGGYSVFAYDSTGTYDSEGENMVGMCRQLSDMDRAVSYVKENIAGGKPIFTMGHSWGGYAAASVMEKHTDIGAAILIAPMFCGATVMIEQSRRRKDPRADLMEDIFREYQRYLFGSLTECNAARGINASRARVLIAQGICDDTLAHDCEAVTAHLSEIRKEGVEVMWCTGSQGTHRGIWHSDAAAEYKRKLDDGIKLAEYLSGAPLEGDALIAYYENVDHRRLSEVNGELVKRIFATFESALNGGSKGGVL